MTGTEKIKEKILEDAKARAASIEEQAKREARDIMNGAVEEADQKKAELLEKAEAEGAELYKRLLAVAGLEGRKEVLRAKQDVIDAAFQNALNKVCSLPDKEYQKLLEGLITDAAGSDGGEVLLSQKDAGRVNSDFIANINKRLALSGKSGLSLSDKHIDAVGGFILKSGGMEINGTFNIMFSMLRNELENDVVDILFGS